MLEIDNVRDHKALGLTDEQVVDMYRKMLLARQARRAVVGTESAGAGSFRRVGCRS